MAYRRVRSYGNTMGATSGTETAGLSWSLLLLQEICEKNLQS
jgi:hypothetical protein